MKIFGIGRNYIEHTKELHNPVPEEPVIFLKPQSALLKKGMPFSIPKFSSQIEYEVEIVLKICRNGKNIPQKHAHKYFREIGVGIDFTARDLQQKQKEKGLPWEIAKAFDHSSPVSEFIPIQKLNDKENISFHLLKNGQKVQEGSTGNMVFGFDKLVSYISLFFTLNIGDLIFTGTPKGVGKIAPNDTLEAFIENEKMLTCEVL